MLKSLAKIIVISFLVGCSMQPAVSPVMVYPGEYVVKEPMRYGGLVSPKKSYVKELNGQIYYIKRSGELLHITAKQGAVEPTVYKENEDLCKSTFSGSLCDPNYSYKALEEPLEPSMWGLGKAPGLDISDINYDTSVKVAVVDTGVNCSHEDITCFEQYNAITDSPIQKDDNGHGSHVAGTICGNGSNHKGITGVARSCRLGAIKFMNASGSGSLFDAVRGIQWAIKNDYQIINNSWGGGGKSKILEDAINEATQKGIIFVAAAGNEANDNDRNPKYPASYENAFSVASIDRNGSLSSFSNYGSKTVDVAAPGRDILSIDSKGGYRELSGTSMATPHVSGLLTLLRQKGSPLVCPLRH